MDYPNLDLVFLLTGKTLATLFSFAVIILSAAAIWWLVWRLGVSIRIAMIYKPGVKKAFDYPFFRCMARGKFAFNVLFTGYPDKITNSQTGETMWTKALGPVSLTAADGKLIVLNEKGTIYIVEASPSSYKEISSGKIPEQRGHEIWWTSPVLLRSMLFCRNNIGDLVSIDVSK